ncbi:substrate-binding periplasmic protein [Shewanella mangrovi]|uniref:substrate-binding periplasmic protein n=1 Tax=Shewanella mangrovi TaxID=1515746 RepID=UPI00068AE5D0|nr:transporter substrate-binding domain-containing protein [Shewanella mangrovi]
MKRLLLVILNILLLNLGWPNSVHADDTRSDKVSFANDLWAPYVDENKDGGIVIEIMRAALALHHKTLAVEITPWARAFHDVRNCRRDLVLVWYVPAREKYVTYSHPFLKNRLRFIKRSGDSYEYSDKDSLKGKTIGIIRGYNYEDILANDSRYGLQANSNFESNLKMLAAGRLDLVLEDEIVAASTIFELNMTSKFSFTGPALNERELFVATGKCNPAGDNLIAAFNDGLTQIKHNGEYARILAKYGALLQSRNAPAIIPSLSPLSQNPRPFELPQLSYRHPNLPPLLAAPE